MDALPEEDEKEGVSALLGGHGGGGFAALLGHGDAAVSPGRNDAWIDFVSLAFHLNDFWHKTKAL